MVTAGKVRIGADVTTRRCKRPVESKLAVLGKDAAHQHQGGRSYWIAAHVRQPANRMTEIADSVML